MKEKPPTLMACMKELLRCHYIIQNYQVNHFEFPFFTKHLDHIRNTLYAFRETPSVAEAKRYLGIVEIALRDKLSDGGGYRRWAQ